MFPAFQLREYTVIEEDLKRIGPQAYKPPEQES
jgi:hypothetical protein